jgi:gas vesicle protein
MRRQRNHQRREISSGEKITFLLVGGGIGAVLALLLTPKPGLELREDIADTTRKGLERGRDAASQIGGRAGEYYGTARQKAGEYYESTRERAGELYGATRERAGGLVGHVREAANRPTNTLSAAIEAGKRAYFEEKRRTESTSITQGRPTYAVENDNE